MNNQDFIKKALEFHSKEPRGKIQTHSSKDVLNNMPLAYSPGVAFPCLEIKKNRENAYLYTNINDSVAIISNGTAVLGLGNLGAIASKPVMEGKAVLFKMAGINCVDIELNQTKVEEMLETISAFAGFGGINLEDIAAPECFELEEKLCAEMDIPIFHDDQHGVAIVACAAIKNALELINKRPEEVKVVAIGAGAAAIASMRMMTKIGIKKENITAFDSKGCIAKDKTGYNKYKLEFAQDKSIALEDAIHGADIFFGASTGGKLNKDFLKKMSRDPIIIATANPEPEIDPILAREIRSDAIICTGRADFPNFYNQVNNLLCFPYIFRVALDMRIKITDEIKLCTVNALSKLAQNQHNYSRERLLPGGISSEVRYLMPGMILKEMIHNNSTNIKNLPSHYIDNPNLYTIDYINKLTGYNLFLTGKQNWLNFEDNSIMEKFLDLLSNFMQPNSNILHKLPENMPDNFAYLLYENDKYQIIFDCNPDENLIKSLLPSQVLIGKPYKLDRSKILGGISYSKDEKKFYYNDTADPGYLLMLSVNLGNLKN